jgi:hypothetical protein
MMVTIVMFEAETYLCNKHMKEQFEINHTTHKTEIPALQDSWFTNTPSVKTLYPQKNGFSLCFRKSLKWLNIGLIRICFFSVSCKILYLWVRIIFSFANGMSSLQVMSSHTGKANAMLELTYKLSDF